MNFREHFCSEQRVGILPAHLPLVDLAQDIAGMD
jgi:hypothetical protein